MDGSQYRGNPAMPGGRSAWRWFPWALAGIMGLVFAVNILLVVTAVRSFPGAAQGNGFELSNAYNHVLENEAQQEALGWQVAATLDSTQHPAVSLTGRDRHALDGMAVEAVATRPLGPPQTTPLAMQPLGAGRYLADTALPSGQWDLTLTVRRGADVLHAVRRIIVR